MILIFLFGICLRLTACANAEDENSGIGDSVISRDSTRRIADFAEKWADTMAEAAGKEAESQRQNNEPEFEDFTQDNEEVFHKAAEMLGLSETEAQESFQILCEDDVFQGGSGELTAFLTGDFDGNGQRDMAAMIHQYPYDGYGSGCIYIYMNEDEPYCFLDEDFPFYSSVFNGMHLSGGDLDNDGVIEILVEASGTGNGGAGDWQGRILKYKDHSLEKTEMLFNTAVGIEVQVIQETGENAYSAYFPEFDETIAFEARELHHYSREAAPVGFSMGMFDMHCVEYQGGYAMEASECLVGEGGNSHIVALAKFIIVWDENGDWRVDRWWIEPVENYY